MLTDRDNYGFNEHTLPPFIALMDAASPDGRQWVHTGVIGYFLTSFAALARVQQVIAQAEHLRGTDDRFANLGIGLAEGRMIADFNSLGRLNPDMMPLGTVANDASRSANVPDAYQQPVQSLSHEFNGNA